MGERRTTLDPLLGPALQLESLPVIPERYASVAEATKLTEVMERLSVKGESPERTVEILSGMLEEDIYE